MGQTLPVKTYPEAPLPDKPAMAGNGYKMFPRIQKTSRSLIYAILIIVQKKEKGNGQMIYTVYLLCYNNGTI